MNINKFLSTSKSEFFNIGLFCISMLVLSIFYPFLILKFCILSFYLIFFIFIPGHFFITRLLPEHIIKTQLSTYQKIILGIPVSIVMLFIFTWIANLIHFPFISCILAIFSLYLIINKFKQKTNIIVFESNSKLNIIICVFYFCAFCFFLFSYYFSIPLPDNIMPGLFYQDMMWSVGNTWSIVRVLDGLPLTDSRYMDFTYNYHLIQNIFEANIYQITKVHPFFLNIYISPLLFLFFNINIIAISANKIARLNIKQTIILLVLIFFANDTYSIFKLMAIHIYYVPTSYFVSLGVFISFTLFMYAYLKNNINLPVVYLTGIFLFIGAAKANLAMTIPATYFFYFSYILFKEKLPKKIIYFCALNILAVLFLRLTIYSQAEQVFNFNSFIIKNSFIKDILNNYFSFLPGAVFNLVRSAIGFLENIFINILNIMRSKLFILFFCLFIFNNNFFLFCKTSFKYFNFILLNLFINIFIISIFNIHDNDTQYFIWYVKLFFQIIFCLSIYWSFFINKNKSIKLVSSIVVVLLILQFLHVMYKRPKNAWWTFPAAKERVVWDQQASIDVHELNALFWLHNNSTANQSFFSDRRYFQHELSGQLRPRFFFYSALSGLRCYAEGEEFVINKDVIKEKKSAIEYRWELINNFLYNTDHELQNISLKQINTDFFIQSKRFNTNDYLTIANLDLIYSNQSINIFKLINKN